jgi:hypothetical protein
MAIEGHSRLFKAVSMVLLFVLQIFDIPRRKTLGLCNITILRSFISGTGQCSGARANAAQQSKVLDLFCYWFHTFGKPHLIDSDESLSTVAIRPAANDSDSSQPGGS